MEFINKHMRAIVLFTGLLLGFVNVSEAQKNNVLFDQGNKQYAAEQYSQAIDSWRLIEKTGNESAALYYNLGNAYYKQNKVGPSIYYYEKALQLAPNDPDIKNNLGFAQNARVDAIEALPKNFIAKTYEQLYSIATYETWAKVTVGLSILSVLGFLLYYFINQTGKKRLFLSVSTISLLLFFIALTMAYTTFNAINKKQPAIIFAESVAVKQENSLGSETDFVLHEGTKVEILEAKDDWDYIRIINGKEGWIPSETLKKL